MSGAALLRAAIARLDAAGIDGAARDARLLLADAMGLAPGRLTVELNEPVSTHAEAAFQVAIAARLARRPVSHIVGRKVFWSGEFEVTEATLAPRPETETLVEQVLVQPFSSMLDLGTGTGCIAISLLAERPAARGVASDISAKALEVAMRNAARHGVSDRLRLVQADWFSGLSGRFDLIVSNPPYIAAAELPALAPEVRDHEPLNALSDGADGLTAYRALARGAPGHLMPGGRLLVEIGPTQGAAVVHLLSEAGFDALEVHRDLDGRDRVVAGLLA